MSGVEGMIGTGIETGMLTEMAEGPTAETETGGK